MHDPARSVLSIAVVAASVLCLAARDTEGSKPTPRPAIPAEATARFSWQRSTPEEQGIDSEQLLTAVKRIRDEKIDVHSLIFIRNHRVVLECYVHPYDAGTVHNVKSVSKSIISALVGIALREGIIESLDQTVASFFPQYFPEGTDARKKKISLRHLLTMTSGLELDENGPIMREIFAADDWIEATFARPMVASPGERFVYSTPLTHTMSAVLTEAGGKDLLELAREHLFGPLGIDRVKWTRGPQGYYFGGAELFLTARDMAKFGLLFVDGGRWEGKQVVPAEWVRESTRHQLGDRWSSRTYGYWWWMKDEGAYAAMGWGGQAVIVDPPNDLVAVGTAADPAAFDKLFRGFEDRKPSGKPLAPKPEVVAELENLVRRLANPEPAPVPEPPAAAAKVSGRWFDLEDNPRGIRRMAFEFPGGDAARILLDRGESGALSVNVGLDGVDRVSEVGTFGHMPDGNRLAHRAEWISDDTFEVHAHEMGNPTHTRMEVRFGEEGIEISGLVRPIDYRFAMAGRRSAATPPQARSAD